MKKTKLIPTLLLAFSAICLFSCEADLEPVDPSISFPEPGPEPIVCTQPSSFQASNFINGTDVNLNWVAGAGETAWQVQYGTQGFTVGTGTTVNTTANHYTVTGLTSTNNYQFYVRSSCGGGNYSAWTGPIAVGGTATACAVPTNVTATRNTDVTKIDLTWVAGTGQTSWQIQYGNAGFVIGNGTTVTSTAPTKQLTGLTGAQAYHVYVRTVCSSTTFSDWVGPINVAGGTTGPVSYGYMNANVNGTQYNGLKPYFYPFTGLNAHIDALSGKLLIQGNSDPLTNPPANFTEITIKIPLEFAHTGTYVLHPTSTDVDPAVTVDLIMVNPTNGWTTYENEIPGTLTITNFDTTNLRIQGTFSFTYELTGDGTGGPFNVSNGTFDFPLEAGDWD